MSEQEQKKGHQRKYPLAVVVGAISVLLALIGLITVLTCCFRLGQRLLDNSREKEKFEQILFPVVMFDPATCEAPEEMDPIILLRSSIWSAFVSNMEKYTLDGSNNASIAKSDVDVACAKLYGPEIALEHQSFSDYMNTYYYDEGKETYLVPFDASSVLYTPQVLDVDKSGVIYTLQVGYLESGNEWLQTLQGRDYEPTPDKYMIYTMKKVDKHFQLVSIQYPEEGAVPGKPVYEQEDPGNLPNALPSSNPNALPPQPAEELLPGEQSPADESTTPAEGEGSGITV